MKHPAYNLRPNKAVDRSLLVERIFELEDVGLINTRNCSYYGFGGPFLDDFRILLDRFPKMSFHSLERSSHTFERQRFHNFSHRVKLHHRSVEGFLSNEDIEDHDHLVWWLDFTALGSNELRDITSLANNLTPGDFIRITTNANPKFDLDTLSDLLGPTRSRNALKAHVQDFKVKFEQYLPDVIEVEDVIDPNAFAFLCVNMIDGALNLRSNLSSTRIWNLGSRVYRDGLQMVTSEFYVSSKPIKAPAVGIRLLENLEKKSDTIEQINVPNLSIKERLHLESALPRNPDRISRLLSKFGYRIENSGKLNEMAMKQYARYHRHYPMLGKVSQ